MMRLWGSALFAAIVLLACASQTDAACSGSGLAWTCAATDTAADVNAAIGAASDGAIVTFTAGTYTISGISMNARNGLTLACETVGACTFTANACVICMEGFTANYTSLMRVTGFVFTGTPPSALLWFYSYSTQVWDIENLRIDHNEFATPGGIIAVLLGDSSVSKGRVYGVMDHNNFHGATNFVALKNTAGGYGSAWPANALGTAAAFFFEDNICNFTSMDNVGLGCIDVWRLNSTVARFNTITNSVLREHSYCHNGPASFEVYGNVIDTTNTVTVGERNIHWQGAGELIAWGNQLLPRTVGKNLIALQHFRANNAAPDFLATTEGTCNSVANGTVTGDGLTPATANDGNRTPTASYYGYPAWHQPGRDGAMNLSPVYMFQNLDDTNAIPTFSVETGTWTGLSVDCADTDAGRVNCHLQSNRDIYQPASVSAQTTATSPFDGTSGTGFGTLANRPTTCTPTPAAADAGYGGVAYWATNQGTWNQSASNPYGVQQNGANGVLYRCSATNTWTVHYTPYTYPHPLQGFVEGASGGGLLRGAKGLGL